MGSGEKVAGTTRNLRTSTGSNLTPLASRVASGVLILASCAAPGATPPTATTNTTSTTAAAARPWTWGVDTVNLGAAYTLGSCEGDADQIACIALDGTVVGSAEYFQLPVSNFDFLEGIENPIESIEAIAADYVATFEADRATTCPELGFESLGPDQVTIAGIPGLRYGFLQTNASKEAVEKNLIYGLRAADVVHIFGFSANAEGSCVGAEGMTPEQLDTITPGLDQAMASVEFPG